MRKAKVLLFVITALLGGFYLYSCSSDSDAELDILESKSVANTDPSITNIYLSYVNSTLLWSYDKEDWLPVGPESPYTIVEPGERVNWLYDSTIENLELEFENDGIFSKSFKSLKSTGRLAQLSDFSDGHSKYDIVFTPTGSSKTFRVDPEIKICDPTKTTCDPT